mgnify:CR=1 FL=1
MLCAPVGWASSACRGLARVEVGHCACGPLLRYRGAAAAALPGWRLLALATIPVLWLPALRAVHQLRGASACTQQQPSLLAPPLALLCATSPRNPSRHVPPPHRPNRCACRRLMRPCRTTTSSAPRRTPLRRVRGAQGRAHRQQGRTQGEAVTPGLVTGRRVRGKVASVTAHAGASPGLGQSESLPTVFLYRRMLCQAIHTLWCVGNLRLPAHRPRCAARHKAMDVMHILSLQRKPDDR